MTEKPTLTKLEKAAEVLHYRILNTQFPLDKKPLQKERAKILEQITGIKLKLETEKETRASKAINALFIKHKNSIFIDVNHNRVTLNENLEISLKYSCGHKHQLHIKELLRFQRNVVFESSLLAKWQGLLSANASLEARFNCSECRKRVAKRLNKFRLRKEGEHIGVCIVTLRKL